MNAREKAIEVMAAAIYEEPYTYCEACKGIGQDENCHFWCSTCNGQGYVVDPDQEATAHEVADVDAAAALDALLAATQEQPCPDCPGDGSKWVDMVPCVTCNETGRVPGAPLVVLGPTLAHPTVRIPDDVPGWEGEILPAAYHDPLREPQVHNANEEQS